MKKLLSLMMAMSFSGAVMASEYKPHHITTMLALMPTAMVYCAFDFQSDCGQVTSLGAATTTTVVVLLKEDIQQVEADGYAFIAGEEMSLALEEVINKARQGSDELNQLSDVELTMTLLQSVK